MKKTLLTYCLVVSVITLALTGCVGVDFCEETNHASGISISLDNDIDKAVVIANRPYNTTKYAYVWDTTLGAGYRIGHVSAEGKDAYNHDALTSFIAGNDLTNAEAQEVKPGKYSFIALSTVPSMRIDQLNAFMSETQASADIIGISLKTYANAADIAPAFTDWIDMNPSVPYAKDEGSIMFDEKAIDIEAAQPAAVAFQLKPITQHVTFELTIVRNNPQLVVDSLHAEISGVVTSRMLREGYLDMNGQHAARMLFAMTPRQQADTAYVCQGELNTLGIMAPASTEMQTGPGIMHVMAYTHLTDTDGRTRHRAYMWGINMLGILSQHPLLVRTRDMQHHVITAAEETVKLPVALHINAEDYDSDADIYQWEHNNSNHVEVEY